MIIYTPVIAGQPNQLQQAIPYGEVHHIERANGKTFLKRKSVAGMTEILETLTAIKNQSQRNDMILVTRYPATVGTATTQFLLPMERIKQMTVASGNRTQITFNDGDNLIVVSETLAQIQVSNGQNLPVGDNFINGVSYPSGDQLSLSYSLGGSPLIVDLLVPKYLNTWFVDAENGDDNSAIRGNMAYPYQNIENAILAASNYYTAQGGSVRQNVIVFSGYYKIEDTVNVGENFLVRDGVDTYCHAGVVIRYLNTDPNQCTEPFFDNGTYIVSSFKGEATIERFAVNSNGTRTVTNSSSQIIVELDSYFGSAMQVNEGAIFWFKCRNFTKSDNLLTTIGVLYVYTTAYCNVKFKAEKVLIIGSISYCCVVEAAVDCVVDFDVENLSINLFGSEIENATFYLTSVVTSGSNFRIGKINQLDFGIYETVFLAVDLSVINASVCKCDNYNEYCGAFFQINEFNTCNSFLIDITGKAVGQALPSTLYSNQRITCKLNVEITDSTTANSVDFIVNCHNGNKDIKPRITGTIKANNVVGGHTLFGADLVSFPTQNALAALWDLQIKTNYTNITAFPSNVNAPCFNLVSNRNFGANTVPALGTLTLSDALAL